MNIIYTDLLACEAKKADVKNFLFYIITHPEYRLVVYYRLYSHWYNKGIFKKFLSKLLWLRAVRNTGCYISPKAKIGKGLRLPHASGIVIGDGARIGEHVTIYQNVTIGTKDGTEKYPSVGDGAILFAGACLIGDIEINNHAIIGANAVVLKDVPENCTAVGVPAKILTV